MKKDAAGIEKVEELNIPRLSSPLSHMESKKTLPAHFRWLAARRWAPAAAIFLAGFLFGRLVQSDFPQWNRSQHVPYEMQSEVPHPTKTSVQNDNVDSQQIQNHSQDNPPPHPNSETYMASLNQPHYTREENGRLIIETPRAVWVVDGRFQLSQDHHE
jgi:hypothetical protein